MKTIKITTLIICAFAFCMAQGIAGETINDVCPIKGKEVKKTVPVKVSFCCKKCKAKFKKAPGDFLEKFAKAKDGECPISGKDIDEEQHAIVKVGVCCNGCAKKLRADPKKYIGDVKVKEPEEEK